MACSTSPLARPRPFLDQLAEQRDVLGRILAHLPDLGRVVLLGGQARGQHVGAQRVVP
jgi:hypothetical protein